MSIKTVSGALDVLNTKVGGTAGDIPADATKVDALKKLYATLGGSPEAVEDISTTSEMVEALAEVAQGGGGDESENTYKVVTLTVINNGNSMVTVNAPRLYDEGIGEFLSSAGTGVVEHTTVRIQIAVMARPTRVSFSHYPLAIESISGGLRQYSNLYEIDADGEIVFANA